MTEQEQIEEMAKVIRPILENRTDICFIPDLDKPIAKELLKHYKPKLPKESKETAKATDRLKENEKLKTKFVKDIEEQAVKEFAEKLKNKLFEFFRDNEELDGKISVGTLYVDVIGVEAKDGTIISLGLIDKLLKEYEVEE